ncbi:uncharacterized protein [Battus philenor]|uniref:uncharacterized protein n=1 Tax=Battus philenor TaxID=42288 RepID=UPI0035CFAB70
MDAKSPDQNNMKNENEFVQIQDTKIMLTNNTCQLNNIKQSDVEKLVTDCFNRPSRMLIDEVMEDEPKFVERTQALEHKGPNKERIRDTDLSAFPSATTVENSEHSEVDEFKEDRDNSNLLKLTKMKWLTESQSDSADSRSPSTRSVSITDSSESESEDNMKKCVSFGEKCLSTILRLDKEHNMFGLSHSTIVDSKIVKKPRKKEEEPAFPQTAIIQVCCGKGCCKHKSNTDLPPSLKPSPCSAARCLLDCSTRFGMKISLKRKPTYEPSPVEITPRSSCLLQKPQAARSCHHMPRCIPPSSCFPYLMPCFWPPRASAPCNTPARCFHNPPCRPPRKRKAPIPLEYLCPHGKKCVDEAKKIQCPNPSCPGKNETMKKEIEKRFGAAKK